MKKLFILLLMMFAGTSLFAGNDATSSPASVPEKTLKVLMIGNSFSICVGEYLPQITDSAPGCKVDLTSAYIGGCSLQTHAQHLEAAEKDPSLKPYRISRWSDKAHKSYAGNVNTLLKEQKWDIITIQQASHYSWRFETFEPYVEKLASYIRKHAPDAEIVIQQTWAYRLDDGRLKSWNLTQQQMYEKLNQSYAALAQKYQWRVIPMGLAVETSRRRSESKFEVPSAEMMKSLIYPDLPRQSADVVGIYNWRMDSKSGNMVISKDSFHLNYRGKYMQAALWFAFLFNRKTSEIGFIPEKMNRADALFLQKCAQEALDTYQQVAKP